MADALYHTIRRHYAALMRSLDQRWVHFLLIALLISCLATWVGPRLRTAVQFDSAVYDQFLYVRGRRAPAEVAETLPETRDIIVISAQHEVPRNVLAKLLPHLRAARVVFLDYMLVDREGRLRPDEKKWYANDIERWRSEDQVLAAAIRDAGNVVLGAWPKNDPRPTPRRPRGGPAPARWSYPPPEIWASARYRAHLSVEVDPTDQVVRRVRLVENADGAALPCAGLAVAAALRGVPPPDLPARQARSLQLAGRTYPLDPDGAIRIGYVGGPESFSQDTNMVAYQVVLDGYLEPADVANKIIVIGETSEVSNDTMPTPFGHMPGLMVHCNIIATLLAANRPLTTAPLAASGAIALVATVLLVALLLRLPLWAGVPLGAAEALAVLAGGAWAARSMDTLLPTSVPILGLVLTYNTIALYEFRRARQTIGLFAGRQMVPRALAIFSKLGLGGQEEDACAFFCDIRGFSALAEHLQPRELAHLTNEYTDALEDIVERRRGCTINYQGDGVFVLFEPIDGIEHHAVRAARAAVELQSVFARLRKRWAAEHAADVQLGIGICAGRMLVGVMGARRRMQFSAVGDAVNIAANIQALSEVCGCGILTTRATRDEIAHAFRAVPCGSHTVKGHAQPIEVYGVLGPNEALEPKESEQTCADSRTPAAPAGSERGAGSAA